jgi:hypothetical protein
MFRPPLRKSNQSPRGDIGHSLFFRLEEHDINKRIPQGRDKSATIYMPERSRSVSARLIRN